MQSRTSTFRKDLAFPKLTEEMVQRLRKYGRVEPFAAHTLLHTQGDRESDMFVVLEGGIDASLSVSSGGQKLFAQHSLFEFSGELSLLNSQRAVSEARTSVKSSLLRISRKELRLLMRAEGDIANIIVSAAIWRRIGINENASSGVVLRGCAGDAALMVLERFLVRNYYPYKLEAISDDDQARLGAVAALDLPSVLLSDGRELVRPTIAALADELGITEQLDPHAVFDVAVVGAGPAGLAAAVYAASEGLTTIVIEGMAPGGQAGTSSKIENYLGFPTGVSGAQLASRGHLQALKFGVRFAISRDIVATERPSGIHQLLLADESFVNARAVVIASGAQYRRLSVKNGTAFENRGLFYAATAMELLFCEDQEIIVVGGGNSAGQASVYLSSAAKHVHHIIRGPSLASTMSEYLISRIEQSPHITLYTDSEIEELVGDSTLTSVIWANRTSGERFSKPVRSVFVMIGAEPNTGWLYGTVDLDSKGFVLTGAPHGFENTPYATSLSGMYAVGDVRSTSVKRVASAVGEGSVVISDVHRYLAGTRSGIPNPTGRIIEAAPMPTDGVPR